MSVPQPSRKRVAVCLSAMTLVTHREVIDVPADITDDELQCLVNQRYEDVDGGSFVADSTYWERGECRAEPAQPEERAALQLIDRAKGAVSDIEGFESEPQPAQAESTVFGTGHAPLVFLEAFASAENEAAPSYATVRVDDAMRTRLLELQALCKEHALSEVRERWWCDWGPGDIENELRLRTNELIVAGDEFWVRSEPTHDEYHVQTRAQSVAAVVEATRNYAGDEPLTFGDYGAEEWQEHVDEYQAACAAADDDNDQGGMRP